MDLQIETRATGATQIIEVKGEVDLYTSPKMREQIFTTIKRHPSKSLIVNLTNVTYVDSSGIATLVEGLQLANEYQIRLKLVGLSRAILEVFQLVRLERVFEIYQTEEEALKSEKTEVRRQNSEDRS
jgi:anti-sigma B factor antagonist